MEKEKQVVQSQVVDVEEEEVVNTQVVTDVSMSPVKVVGHPFLVPALTVSPLTTEVIKERSEAFNAIRSLLTRVTPIDIRGRKYYGWEQLAPIFPVLFQHSNVTVTVTKEAGITIASARFRGITLGGSYIDLTAAVSEQDPIVKEAKHRDADWVKVMMAKASTQAAVRAIKFAAGWAAPLVEEFVGTGADPELEERAKLVDELRSLIRDLGITEQSVIRNLNRKTKSNYKSLMEIPNDSLLALIDGAKRKLEVRRQEISTAINETAIEGEAEPSNGEEPSASASP